ncbi:glycyl radical protein [Sporomusa acidovorans]|uniref:Trans-4-hydroxy-L-proline dehydratase n=1 Tax=Sporomusa acidovorans (strain ATCC 49682 / DSM 3132 / Mol) TaxID=1123286 RepID=A0ABZ3J1B7_SPOA4|nr:pyruvate formate lyase family protein [Sporomusa acidovorans]OZC21318.1 4-hydroxyphenylacetate decarboxylase large subunit [Sporomusa acidovorans DSM 3132]SDE57462.1 formate C-acetyltransferase [Sporomusa acidovorans]
MYKFKSATERIKLMRELIRDRVIQTDAERALITTDSYKRNEHVVPIIKRPLATYDVCSKMTLRVEDFEIIVGNKAQNFLGSGINPEWSGTGWIPDGVEKGLWTLEADGLYHNPANEELKLTIAPEDVEALLSIRDYWKDKTVTATANAWQPDGYQEFSRLNVSSYVPGAPLMYIPTGHLTPGFEKIINVGYAAIRQHAQDWLDAHEGNLMGEDMNKYMFYKSAVIACDAATILVKRYGQTCLAKAAACQDPTRKAELTKMGESLLWISENPARTFWEACQGTIMYQLFLSLDSRYPACAFGRFDQYTWPFLKADLESGRITLDEAQEIVDAFFLKANCFYNAAPDFIAVTTGIGNTYQHTTIGGVNRDTGEDATNPVTYMVLETIGRLKLHDPTISLRINTNTPDELWECAIETSKLVGGLPLFQNDEIIIPGLMKELNFTLRDARDYSLIGCQEIVGSGNDYPAPNGVHAPHASVHYGVIFDMAINNGINPYNGTQCKLKTGYLYEMESFEKVKAAVKAMCSYIQKWHITVNNYSEYLTMYHAPHAGLSISIEGCMESGTDCVCGGAKYNSYGGTATGLATLADSLTTIKYMIFDKKLCTARELYDAVMANWEGYEPLRQRILSEVPHYGNDDPYADEQMKWICDVYSEICGECYSTRSKVYKGGLYGASDHVAQGYHTWATPDGRKTGEPLADATSPAQGRDHEGPTAVFNSICCLDHSRYMDGIALNLRIHPTALRNAAGIDKLRDMTKSYFKTGGMEVQYNVVSSETLRAAQADPQSYRDLVVRIAGYSAYFVELSRDCQNDIISRNENMF